MERLKKVGALRNYSASEIVTSRLGIGFEKLDRNVFDPEKAYDKVSKIGVKYARLQSGWMRTEKEKGVYDFAWLDSIVDNLIARGMKPWLCLCYGNPLYTPLAKLVFGAVGCPPINSDEAKEAWLNYVRATVSHFKGRISVYEIWNEPDCPYSWKHIDGETKADIDLTVNAKEYGEFALATAIAVKETDTDARVAGFAIGHSAVLKFVNDALSTGLYKYIDYVSFHSYSSYDMRREKVITALRRLIDHYDPKIKLIQGESGAQSRSDGNGAMKGFAWTREKQTKMLLRTLVCDLYCGLEFSSYFSCMDMIEALHGRVGDKSSYLDYGYFGVLSAEFDEDGRATGEYTEKPSYYALSALASLMRENAESINIPYALEDLPSRRVNGRDCTDDSIKVYPFRLCDGRTALIYWNAVYLITTSYEGTASFSVFGEDTEEIRLIDLRDGSIYELPEEMTEDLGDGGVRLKNIPLTDTPLALVFGKEK